jgi:predicted transcriptional regulator YdeE
MMSKKEIDAFSVIGMAVKTENRPGFADVDIPKLWQQFMSEAITTKIPNKLSDTIYCVYTKYEGDFTQPYTTVLGCKVAHLSEIPVGMIGIEIPSGNYHHTEVKGNTLEGIVFAAWQTIWQTPLNRTYAADFEVYDERAANPNDAQISIFVGIQE